MNTHIFKYEIPLTDEIITLNLPKNFQFCDIQEQNNALMMWGAVDPHTGFKSIRFKIFGTGWKIENLNELFFLKTVVMKNGYVWHIFQVRINEN
jgi:hypothetical protein